MCPVSSAGRSASSTGTGSTATCTPALPDNKIDQLFSLCVNFLLLVAKRVGMTYNEINIWIFCIIWPIITILSIALNIVLLCW